MRRRAWTLNAVVIDSSVAVEWFEADGEPGAVALRGLLSVGDAIGIASPILPFEVLNVAGRSWRWPASDLAEIRSKLVGPVTYQFPPDVGILCRWIEAGLTSYDASYAALAEEFGLRLATEDRQMLEMIPGARTARALVDELA